MATLVGTIFAIESSQGHAVLGEAKVQKPVDYRGKPGWGNEAVHILNTRQIRFLSTSSPQPPVVCCPDVDERQHVMSSHQRVNLC